MLRIAHVRLPVTLPMRCPATVCLHFPDNGAYGLPTCANDAINNGLVRGDWGWEGFFVSDCTALELMQDKKWDNCQHPWPSEGGTCTYVFIIMLMFSL